MKLHHFPNFSSICLRDCVGSRLSQLVKLHVQHACEMSPVAVP